MKLVALVEGCLMRFEAFLVLIPLCIPNILLLPRRAVKSCWMWGMWSLHGCACVYESLFSSLFSFIAFPWRTSSWSSWGLKPLLQVLCPAEVATPWRSTGSLVSTEPLCFFGDLAVPDMHWHGCLVAGRWEPWGRGGSLPLALLFLLQDSGGGVQRGDSSCCLCPAGVSLSAFEVLLFCRESQLAVSLLALQWWMESDIWLGALRGFILLPRREQDTATALSAAPCAD